MRELREQRTLLVAAAGNNGCDTPFWPPPTPPCPRYADCVLSVGALRADGESGACFTNHGPWVRVHAPGEAPHQRPHRLRHPRAVRLPALHLRHLPLRRRLPVHLPVPAAHRCAERGPGRATGAKPDQVMFEGLAQWSGTSFATPVAAGLVAARMTAYRERDPRAAGAALLADATERAEVRGAHVPALRPPTLAPRPGTVIPRCPRDGAGTLPLHGVAMTGRTQGSGTVDRAEVGALVQSADGKDARGLEGAGGKDWEYRWCGPVVRPPGCRTPTGTRSSRPNGSTSPSIWAASGNPDKAGAWLASTARHGA